MRTDELEKLYKNSRNEAAPDFWDRIDAGLKPHAQLSEEEKNAFCEPEEAELQTAGESGCGAGGQSISGRIDHTETETGEEGLPGAAAVSIRETGSTEGRGKQPVRMNSHRRRKGLAAAAAAAVILLAVPALLLFSGTGGSGKSMQGAAETEAAAEAAAEAGAAADSRKTVLSAAGERRAETAEGEKAAGTAGMEDAAETTAAAEPGAAVLREASEGVTAAAAEISVTAAEGSAEAAEAVSPEERQVLLLTVPESAEAIPADAMYFTEEILEETDMLAIVEIESAEFEFSADGRAYRLNYGGTVREALLEEGESARTGSSLRIVSPIVSDGTAGGEALYQLVPGQTYILPLKKSAGDWELLCPCAPQILLREDGSFVFHTGYSSLLNDQTEAVLDRQVSEDDFWYDRRVSRSDASFLPELTALIRTVKQQKGSNGTARPE